MLSSKNIYRSLILIVISIQHIVYASSLNTISPFKNLETSFHGRLGIYAINTANNEVIAYRADELFPMCSTSKVMVVANTLHNSEIYPNLLQENISYTKDDVKKSGYAPITKDYQNMPVSGLCEAAIECSDNNAMNLLITRLGGVEAVNKFAQSINDKNYHLDRMEPFLNSAIPSDKRDTTTPQSMATSLQKLALENYLKSDKRELLKNWLTHNTTGNARIRAGVPKYFIVGDKTGTGNYGTTNDVGIIWPPHKTPIIIAIYLTQYSKNVAPRDDIIASATRLILSEFARTNRKARN